MPMILTTVALLILSNGFMTFAWYDHLRNKQAPILATIFLCWLIALPEYALQVPANRIGNAVLTATQLKIIQESISLGVFVLFAWWRLGEPPTWRTFVAILLVLAAVWVVRSGPKA